MNADTRLRDIPALKTRVDSLMYKNTDAGHPAAEMSITQMLASPPAWDADIMLCESGVDPLITMKIVGHTDCQTAANIYAHVRDEMLKKATVDLEGVFKKRAGKE